MSAVRHLFSCPLRWADLDILGHVNNVRYADYLREARDDLLRTAGIDAGPGGLQVRRHELTFRAPLGYGAEPVVIECWLSTLADDKATIESVIRDDAETATVYLRARSDVTPRDPSGRPRSFSPVELAALTAYVEPGEPRVAAVPVRVRAEAERHYAAQVRAGDLDVTGVVSDVALVEFFQEARIAFFDRMLPEGLARTRVRWVVAQTDLDLLAPVERRPAAYDCFTRLARVGNRSLTTEAVLRDDTGTDLATARVVLVVFDPVANRSVEPPADYRELLETFVSTD